MVKTCFCANKSKFAILLTHIREQKRTRNCGVAKIFAILLLQSA